MLGIGNSIGSQRLGTMIFNNAGTQLLQKHEFYAPKQRYYPQFFGNLFSLTNGDFISTLTITNPSYASNQYVTRGALVRFNNIGDTIFLQSYTDTLVASEHFNRISKVAGNGDLIIGGDTGPPPYNASRSGLIIRTDSNGTLKWRKTYSNNTVSNYQCTIVSIQALPDGRIFACGQLTQFVHYNAIFDYNRDIPWLFVADSAGNILKDTTLIHYSGHSPQAFTDKNGGYTLYGALDSFLLPNNPYSFMNFPAFVAHLDTNFHITWERNFACTAPHIYDSSSQIDIRNGKQLGDGSYLLMGQFLSTADNNPGSGWACKMDRGGRILWKNYYTLDTVYEQHLYDAVEKPDKSIIFCGDAADHNTPTWRQYDVWILGVDSNGCAQPGCPPTAEPVGVAHSPTLPKASLLLYPNPITGSFTLRASEAGVLTVYSVQGSKVAEYTISPTENKLMFAPTMASGIYFGRFTSAKGSTQLVRIIYQP